MNACAFRIRVTPFLPTHRDVWNVARGGLAGFTLQQIGAVYVDLIFHARCFDRLEHLEKWVKADGSPWNDQVDGVAIRVGITLPKTFKEFMCPPVNRRRGMRLVQVGLNVVDCFQSGDLFEKVINDECFSESIVPFGGFPVDPPGAPEPVSPPTKIDHHFDMVDGPLVVGRERIGSDGKALYRHTLYGKGGQVDGGPDCSQGFPGFERRHR